MTSRPHEAAKHPKPEEGKSGISRGLLLKQSLKMEEKETQELFRESGSEIRRRHFLGLTPAIAPCSAKLLQLNHAPRVIYSSL